MRISDKQVQQAIKAYGDQIRRPEKAVAKPVANASHEIRLSPESQEYLSAMKALKALPEVEDVRVEALRQQVEAGTYQPNSAQVARKMLTRNLVDRLI